MYVQNYFWSYLLSLFWFQWSGIYTKITANLLAYHDRLLVHFIETYGKLISLPTLHFTQVTTLSNFWEQVLKNLSG